MSEDVTTFYSRTNVFKYSFFSSTILEWNKLDRRMQQSTTMLSFRNALLKIGRSTPKPVYNILDPNSLHLLTRLRLGLSHLNELKFNRNFKECVNPLYSRSLLVESVSPFVCTVITSQILENSKFDKVLIHGIGLQCTESHDSLIT